ncbi:MAG: hypothetical protein SFT92_06930 [Rickettsiales bacterium]|nr:hypothetical protein [Rickettsiales bacterium]
MLRVIICHTFEDVIIALEAASELSVELALQSAPDAIFYAGALYLLHMYRHACELFPQVRSRFIVDCADAGAEAIAAMQMGHRYIRSSAPDDIQQKLADIAKSYGASLESGPYEALDLRQAKDTKAASVEWLKGNL